MQRREVREIARIIQTLEVLKQNILLLEKSRAISRLWHKVHIVAAVIMFIILPIHIAVGLLFGI